MTLIVFILSILLITTIIFSFNYKLKYDKLLSSSKKKTDKLDIYLNDVKNKITIRYNELFSKKTKGFYEQDLSYNGENNKLKVRVFIRKEYEYENDFVDVSYDYCEIIYNHSNATKSEIINYIKDNISMMKNEQITWLLLKNKTQIERKKKLENLLELINEEIDKKNDNNTNK